MKLLAIVVLKSDARVVKTNEITTTSEMIISVLKLTAFQNQTNILSIYLYILEKKITSQ